MHKAIKGHLMCLEPDAILNIETHLFNVTLCADSCEYTLDIGKEVWLNRQRWSRLIKEYVSADALNRFIDQMVEIRTKQSRDGATANMLFVDPKRYEKKHRWGGCLMGATFRGDGGSAGKSTITFYSRTTYIGYMGLLDSAIAAVLAKELCDRVTNTTIDDIAFRWHISSQQLHSFKTLPFVYSNPDLLQLVRDARSSDRATTPPTLYHMAKWYNKVVTGWSIALAGGQSPEDWLETEKYGPLRRIKRRWLEFKGFLSKHIPPSCPVSSLTFEKAE